MSGERVLIIDDDEAFVAELKELLGESGYGVDVITDSGSAVKMARKIKPDVILLDLKMRPMNGFEVANELKLFPKTKDIPLIAMSGYYAMDKRSWLMNFCGFQNCIKKPFNPLNIIMYVEAALKVEKH